MLSTLIASWPLASPARYVEALRVREALLLAQPDKLVRCINQVYNVGIEYYNERSLKRGFNSLVGLEASREDREYRIHDAHCRAARHRYWLKLAAISTETMI